MLVFQVQSKMAVGESAVYKLRVQKVFTGVSRMIFQAQLSDFTLLSIRICCFIVLYCYIFGLNFYVPNILLIVIQLRLL